MQDLSGKRIAVLLKGETASGEEDWVVLAGVAYMQQEVLFIERTDSPPFEIQAEWLDRIRPVNANIKDILLGAEFCITLSVGPLPEGESAESYIATGFKWPT